MRSDAYAERVVGPLWNVDAHDFNGNLPALELALVH